MVAWQLFNDWRCYAQEVRFHALAPDFLIWMNVTMYIIRGYARHSTRDKSEFVLGQFLVR